MDTELSRSDGENQSTVTTILSMVKDDDYLAEKLFLPEEMQTLGYMRSLRDGMDLFDSVESVRARGDSFV